MKRLFLSVTVLIAVLLIASCGGATGSTTTPTSTTPIITTTTQTTTAPLDPSVGAPSVQDLTEEDFISPELPRITAERLKQFMDNGETFVVVDTRIDILYDIGHIPESINIPFDPEDAQTASFLLLPKDRFIILYCD